MVQRKKGDNLVTVGNIIDTSGEVNIAGGNIGYTAGQVSELLRQINSTFQPKPFEGLCPYKGLDVFEAEDAELFFGRERLVEDLTKRVKESRAVFVTGPSGSGKSSLVRAGLFPALKQGAIKELHSERWCYGFLKPGRDPLMELARVASSIAGTRAAGDDIRTKGSADKTIFSQWCEIALKEGSTKRAVLFIDQFEEIFTQISKEQERRAFLNLLTYAATVKNGRVILIFAIRSDFISSCATYPQLNDLLNEQFIQVGAMQPHELVSAIVQPALRVGLRIDPELIAKMINDMQSEPGALPLMQFALKDLFDSQQTKGGVIALTLNGYLERGGIHKSLERHADNSFAKLSESEKELARFVFSGLIEIGRGTQDTCRTALFDELIPADTNAETVRAIVQKLADARLIITDEQAGKDTVTISHEKLIDAWPWLKSLVNESRDLIVMQNEIAQDAKEWDGHNQDKSYLYTGMRLSNARASLADNKLVLSDLARLFIEASVKAYADELEAANQRTAQLRRRSTILMATSVAAITAMIIAVFFAIQFQEQAKLARAGELAAQTVFQRQQKFDLSLLLAVEAYHTKDTIQTKTALVETTRANPQLIQYFHVQSGSVTSVGFSPDGKTLASGSSNGTITFWNAASRQPIGHPLTVSSAPVYSFTYSQDGKTLASGSSNGTITLWNVASRQPIGQPLDGKSGPVSKVTFSPDGKTLASGSYKSILLWDIADHQLIGKPLTGYSDGVSSFSFGPDAKTLASGSFNRIILWDLASRQTIGQPLSGHNGSMYFESVAFSPDGKTLAAGTLDSKIILWDVAGRRPIGQPLTGHSSPVLSIAFSPDGKTLASGDADNTIILWDLSNHQRISQPLAGHSNPVISIAFSPDGKTLASGSADSIILWDVATLLNPSLSSRQPIAQPLTGHRNSLNSVAFSPDGKTLASASTDDTIVLWDVASHRAIGQPISGHSDSVESVAFSPDGKTLASGSFDTTIILWDVASHRAIGQPLTGHNDTVSSVTFSPDGKTLASGSSDNMIILWDVASRRAIGLPLTGHKKPVISIAFSPDGKTLASGSSDNMIILWDVASHQAIGQPLVRHSDYVLSVAFSPDGKTLASGSQDDTVILWDLTSHQPMREPLTGHNGPVHAVAFSPDGKTLASGNRDGTIILWDLTSYQPIGQPLTSSVYTGLVLSLAFSPDGKTLAAGNSNNLILWDVAPQSWIEQSCQRAGRNLTRAEWGLYFSNEEYRATCPQWPLEQGSSTISDTIQ
jgi:WD40 repeat protein